MSSQVTLKISKGFLLLKEESFMEKETVAIGRANDCRIILDNPIVSRYHCIMEINNVS
ncbi:MAG: FHA domain-containing protein [Bacteroidales bacterium]|jgi:pSer/pThr/pTyr-binding forkhead associated (FHA) protein|nr:FHA domain-containing protein [Bacteroidales bacterium]